MLSVGVVAAEGTFFKVSRQIPGNAAHVARAMA